MCPVEATSRMKEDLGKLAGQLFWVGVNTRPDLAADASMQSTEPTTDNLTTCNKVLRKADRSKSNQLNFPRLMPPLTLDIYCDAAFANRQDGGSQAGSVIFLKDSKGAMAPLAWRSAKIQRVVRSTLSAETCDAIDTALFVEAGSWIWEGRNNTTDRLSIPGQSPGRQWDTPRRKGTQD
eukprot:GHVN01078121.1.p1 GENE.GHVN01078121.1~~GHVN01078121.1.p1  ORF type:complete len:179 (-),score=22.84 GHVN01078121.1:266-802(-)